jgi:DNA-binding SARP family transcriptional activator/Tfp pilus assembly protein PilF
VTGDSVEFRVLGPLEVTVGPERLDLGGTRQQVVLAVLVLNAGTVVSIGRLQEAIYGEDLPPTSRSQAQISISSLRRLLASQSQSSVITTRAHGYLLQVGDGQLDSLRFADLTSAARAAREAGDPGRAVACYRDALRLWRGPALEGIDSQVVRAAASRLDELRITTNEERLALELDLGRHHELVGELAELVAASPLRERLRAQLMLALYRCGRTAEALQAYRDTRRTMVDELGIEPGEELRRLEHSILTSDPAIDLPAGRVRLAPEGQQPDGQPPQGQQPDGQPRGRNQPEGPQPDRQVPSLLPADIADFTGRSEQVSEIRRRLLRRGRRQAGQTLPIVVLVGQAGVGKTSLAVHAAHGLAGQFPDGQLFADLHGTASRRVAPVQVLERFLRALGMSGPQIPEDLDERAEMYRGLLAGRRILVVLDDAVGESQVTPLLPGSAAAAVLITSRARLAGLPGAAHVEVNVLDLRQSLSLLARIAGPARVRAQPEAVAAVARYCGHLPLALRIAGARLSAHPHWSVRQLRDRLADEARRLDELRHGDMGVRASISLTYQGASDQARCLLRRLALLEAPAFSSWVSAALLDLPLQEAEDVLEDLVRAQLVETVGVGSGAASHYRLHELIGVFARERLAAEETAAERFAAAQRALHGMLHLAEEAHRRFYGSEHGWLHRDEPRWLVPDRQVDDLLGDPLSWYERERAALMSAVRQAAHAGLPALCWSLAISAETLFEARGYFDDWREASEVALDAARKAHDTRGQAVMLYSRGTLRVERHQHGQARGDLTTAARLFQDIGDDEGMALVGRNIAYLDRLRGRLDDAARRYEQALTTFTRTGDRVAAVHTLHCLAQIKMERDELGAATELLDEALRLAKTVPSGRMEAQVLNRIGESYLLAGDPARAAATFQLALAKVRDVGDPVGEAFVLQNDGVARLRQGEFGQARGVLQRALELARSVGESLAEGRTLIGLADLALASGDPVQAAAFAEQAAAVFGGISASHEQARAVTMLDRARAALGNRAPR